MELRNEAEGDASSNIAAANASGDLILKEIPPLPKGKLVKAKEPNFRTRTLALPDGLWKVSFDGDEIKISTGKGKAYSLPMAWYPEEGGADGASCNAYLDGAATWIVLSGSSDYTDEVTRIRFVNGRMKEVIKHRVPGNLASLGGIIVLPADRIKTQTF